MGLEEGTFVWVFSRRAGEWRGGIVKKMAKGERVVVEYGDGAYNHRKTLKLASLYIKEMREVRVFNLSR